MARKTSSHTADKLNSISTTEIIQEDKETSPGRQKRSRLQQSKMPFYSLEEALRIPQVIGDEYAFKPTSPLDIATALGVQPTTSGFRMLTGAAAVYGLTEGSYNASLISVTPLALRILKPSKNDESLQARREAFLRPSISKEFLTHYDNHKLPREDIAKSMLISMGVPKDAVGRVLSFIIDGAKQIGFLRDINGALFVSLQSPIRTSQNNISDIEAEDEETLDPQLEELSSFQKLRLVNETPMQQMIKRRVFITYGRNKSFIEPLKNMLSLGDLEPIVSIEHESISQTIPDKVMSDMRSCNAAIIHIEDEQNLLDPEGNMHILLNSNVLIEIGASMALYGRNFILLVKSDVKLPSNLQGLYEVRYDGDRLEGDATLQLLKAITDLKNRLLSSSSNA